MGKGKLVKHQKDPLGLDVHTSILVGWKWITARFLSPLHWGCCAIEWNTIHSALFNDKLLTIPRPHFALKPSLELISKQHVSSSSYLLSMCSHFLQCTVLNLNGWFFSSRKCYFELFMYIGFSWECEGGLRVLARSDNHIFTFSVADENDLFLFQAGKRQQVCKQRLRSLESGLRGQQHYILGIFWNLFVVLYSGILTPILFFTILYMVVTYAILRVISSDCQFKLFRRLVTVPGSSS